MVVKSLSAQDSLRFRWDFPIPKFNKELIKPGTYGRWFLDKDSCFSK